MAGVRVGPSDRWRAGRCRPRRRSGSTGRSRRRSGRRRRRGRSAGGGLVGPRGALGLGGGSGRGDVVAGVRVGAARLTVGGGLVGPRGALGLGRLAGRGDVVAGVGVGAG